MSKLPAAAKRQRSTTTNHEVNIFNLNDSLLSDISTYLLKESRVVSQVIEKKSCLYGMLVYAALILSQLHPLYS